MNAVSILIAALALISAPSKWTKEDVAQNAQDRPVKPTDERAKRFCMVGAIQRVATDASAEAYGQAITLLRKACGEQSIFEFNDKHGHKAALTCMRRAIAAGEVAA
ncbi:MAG TPA: hypothetical protein VGO22_14735 [Pseudorhizobium sp.]|jgi:predicted alpha/beta superfamily hydrolase|nr:hypothetical protein [Pseudorhizobium sp.]